MLMAQCPRCGGGIELYDDSQKACSNQCKWQKKRGVLVIGEGYSDYIVSVHRQNIDTAEKLASRQAWERHYVNWCLNTARPFITSSDGCYRVLSLGTGLGLDVAEFVANGHDAYGIETADISGIWADVLGNNAPRCIVSTNGAIPFQEKTFDLIVSMNVLEHVGTIPPKEIVTTETDNERLRFVLQAVSHLRPGGVFLLVAPSRCNPIDRGHAHHYMPYTYAMMKKFGFSLANPFSKKNFLPSPGDVRRWCRQIGTTIKVSVTFRDDRSLFGTPPVPENLKGRLMYHLEGQFSKYFLPHLHAVIRREQ